MFDNLHKSIIFQVRYITFLQICKFMDYNNVNCLSYIRNYPDLNTCHQCLFIILSYHRYFI